MRASRRVVVVVLVALAVLRLGGAQQAAGTGVISGNAIDAGTGSAVAGAMATIAGSATVAGSRVSFTPRRVVTDSSGRFVFRNLPQGTFGIEVTATGYPASKYGQKRPAGDAQQIELAEGAHVVNVSVSLWKHAAISGTIVDEVGEPMAEVRVQALRRTLIAGRRRMAPTGPTTLTDDRGVYRISALTPGDFIVVVPSIQTTVPTSVMDGYAQASAGAAALPAGQRPAMMNDLINSGAPSLIGNYIRVGDFQLQTYAYPGRMPIPPQPADAGKVLVYPIVASPIVALGSGEERMGVDLQLRAVLSLRVSGSVIGPDGPVANLALDLMSVGNDATSETGMQVALTLSNAGGAFTFMGVPPGQYKLSARKTAQQLPPVPGSAGPSPLPPDPSFWAEQVVSVGETDVHDLNVAMRQALRVSGRIEFEGVTAKPAADRLRTIPVTIERVDASSLGITNRPGQVDPSGRFNTMGFTPGKYLVRIGGAPTGWALKSAMFNGRDVSETPLDLEGGDVSGVVITFTDRPIELGGTVRDADGTPDAGAGVVMFPVDRAAWMDYGLNPRRIRSTRPARDGVYRFAAYPYSPAGDYYVVAVNDEQLTDWRDPDFLEKLSRVATRVTLGDGDRKTLDLKTSQVR